MVCPVATRPVWLGLNWADLLHPITNAHNTPYPRIWYRMVNGSCRMPDQLITYGNLRKVLVSGSNSTYHLPYLREKAHTHPRDRYQLYLEPSPFKFRIGRPERLDEVVKSTTTGNTRNIVGIGINSTRTLSVRTSTTAYPQDSMRW
jgi:hypothetical protein